MSRVAHLRLAGGPGTTIRRLVLAGLALGLAVTCLAVVNQKDSGMFVHEVALDHPVEQVWEAITRKSAVDRYYLAPLGADVGTAGAEIFYGTAAQKLIVGRVIESKAPRQLVHSFRFAGENEPDSVVTYALTASAAGTRLRIEHRGYAPGTERHSDISLGWPIITDGLAEMLAGHPPR